MRRLFFTLICSVGFLQCHWLSDLIQAQVRLQHLEFLAPILELQEQSGEVRHHTFQRKFNSAKWEFMLALKSDSRDPFLSSFGEVFFEREDVYFQERAAIFVPHTQHILDGALQFRYPNCITSMQDLYDSLTDGKPDIKYILTIYVCLKPQDKAVLECSTKQWLARYSFRRTMQDYFEWQYSSDEFKKKMAKIRFGLGLASLTRCINKSLLLACTGRYEEKKVKAKATAVRRCKRVTHDGGSRPRKRRRVTGRELVVDMNDVD